MQMNTPSTPTSASLIKQDLRRTIMAESILFLVLGVTSYLSLIFMPRDVLTYFIGAILYGAILLISGSVGLYGSYKVEIKFVYAYMILLILSALANSLAFVACLVLLIQHILDGVPDCSQTCDLAKFVFVTFVFYFIIQAVLAVVLLIYSGLSFRHTLVFYKKEKRFLVGFTD